MLLTKIHIPGSNGWVKYALVPKNKNIIITHNSSPVNKNIDNQLNVI